MNVEEYAQFEEKVPWSDPGPTSHLTSTTARADR